MQVYTSGDTCLCTGDTMYISTPHVLPIDNSPIKNRDFQIASTYRGPFNRTHELG